MSTLTGQFVSQSYGGLLHLSTNTNIVGGTFTSIEDGGGNALGILVKTGGQVSGSGFTGSFNGTATSASFAITALSASFAISASHAQSSLSSSYALTASYANTATSASYAPDLTNTGSFATTGSNQFTGSQTITGSIINKPIVISPSSNTASINLDLGNTFTLTLIDSVTLHISASNLKAGQSCNLQITQPAGVGSVTFNSVFTFPSGSSYVAFQSASAVDVLSFTSFDGAKLRTVASNYFI